MTVGESGIFPATHMVGSGHGPSAGSPPPMDGYAALAALLAAGPLLPLAVRRRAG
ncbi:hypothetical protein ABZ572_34895 [Streptomyces sp. NPDC018338]|uniref:hypothetical protein n=1 Tax=Streptomyces sp. NPDC018338 TaxID=3157192 RepID=UPI0033CB0E7F